MGFRIWLARHVLATTMGAAAGAIIGYGGEISGAGKWVTVGLLIIGAAVIALDSARAFFAALPKE